MSHSPLTLRHATLHDAELLANLGRQTFTDSFAADNNPEDFAAYLESAFSPEIQAAELAEHGSTFLIAEHEQAPVGYARLRAAAPDPAVTGPRPIELVRIYAVQEWIGKGVGSFLMRACLDEALRQGYETVWLGVWERNPRAIAFYEKWGFKKVGSHIFHVGSDPQTDWIMQRPIP